MDLVAIEAPATGVASSGKTFKLLDAAFGVITATQLLQVIANQFVKAFAQCFRFLAGAGNNLFID